MDVIRFEGIDNFRDFGGVDGADGRRVRTGRLYRSAHHGRATAGDLERLKALKLALIADLRRPEERQREPSARLRDEALVVLEDDHPDPAPDGYQAFLQTSDHSVAEMRRFLFDYYAKAPFEPRLVLIYRRYLAALSGVDGAALIHCAAGKDRTGILAALTHQALGAPFEASLADYLLTNDPDRIAQRVGPFGDYVEAVTGRRPTDAAIRATLGVEADYLLTAFDRIRNAFGSVETYLEVELGVDAERRRSLRDRLLE